MKYINNLRQEEVLTSYNFARNADIVYSEIISLDKYQKLENKNHDIIYQDQTKVFYKTNKFILKENQIIFCNSNLLDSLFTTINKNKKNNFKNIKLITHQTDLSISKKVFRKKPNCISKWFAINVDYEHRDLIPIPIGLSNDYSPKNIMKDDYKELEEVPFNEKANLLYVNFQRNTNFISRYKLESKLKIIIGYITSTHTLKSSSILIIYNLLSLYFHHKEMVLTHIEYGKQSMRGQYQL